MQEFFFGDKNLFAIRYIPGYKYFNNANACFHFAKIHLLLKGQLIGDPDDISLAGTWINSIKKIRNQISHNFHSLYNDEFINRSDEDVFELINKANQIEIGFDKKYQHLSQLDHSVWVNCKISLDETTDAWIVRMIAENNDLKFLWKGWRSPCPLEYLNKLFSITVNKEMVLSCIDKFLIKIEEDMHHFPIQG